LTPRRRPRPSPRRLSGSATKTFDQARSLIRGLSGHDLLSRAKGAVELPVAPSDLSRTAVAMLSRHGQLLAASKTR
jgi:hypothetical protein